MKAGFIQTSPVFGNVRNNVENVISKIYSTDAFLLVLPELFNTGYQFKSKKEVSLFAEEIPWGWTSKVLIETAKKKNMFIVAGIAEKYRNRFYNSSILAGPKGVIGVYRKMHLFWNEKKLFNQGDKAFAVYNIGPARVGMMICFDWLFPEAARILAIMGADIICHPSNLVLPHCPQAMITRCLENRVFSITANRTGVEKRSGGTTLKFIGQSEIVTPDGTLLYRASADKVEVGTADIDPKKARNKNITPFNNILKDRKKKFYTPLV